MGDSGYDIKLELEEEEEEEEDLGRKSRGEDVNFETNIKKEQLEAGFEEKEAGEVGGDLDLLFKIKQEMEE